MSKRDILKRINKALSPNKVDFSLIDKEVETLKKKLEETVNIATIDDVKSELNKFKKKIDLSPLITEIDRIEELFNQKFKEIQKEIEEKDKEIEKNLDNDDEIEKLNNEIALLKNQQQNLVEKKDLTIFSKSDEIRGVEFRIDNTIKSVSDSLKNLSNKDEVKKVVKEIEEKIDDLRRNVLTRLSSIGGGSMNRQIRIGGIDYLTRYTDINLKAGSNMSITVANDDVKKSVDITFTASGGGVNIETPTGDIDDSNLTFTVVNEPKLLNINGAVYSVGIGLYSSYLTGTITLSSPVGVGGFIINIY